MNKQVPGWVWPNSTLITSFLSCSPQGGESGEEQLCADLPELDLSQLDTGDFDSATCFGELQWCPETSETEPIQYSPDDSELFQVSPTSRWPRPVLSSQSPAFWACSSQLRSPTQVLVLLFPSLDPRLA